MSAKSINIKQKRKFPKKISRPKQAIKRKKVYKNSMIAPSSQPRMKMAIAPIAEAGVVRNTRPAMVQRVVHREPVFTFDPTTTAFQVTRTTICPSSFAWASSFAANFELYKIRRMRFIYVPSCPTTTNGRIVMAIAYDEEQPTPGSSFDMESLGSSVAYAPWVSTHISLDCKGFANKAYYVEQTDSSSKRMEFVGNFMISSEGVTGTLGDVFVEYDIEFSRPRLSYYPTSTFFGSGSAVTSALPLGTLDVKSSFPKDTISLSASSPNSKIVFTRPGYYAITYYVVGSGVTTYSSLFVSGGSFMTVWAPGTQNSAPVFISGSAGSVNVIVHISSNVTRGNPATITFVSGQTAGTATCTVLITKVDNIVLPSLVKELKADEKSDVIKLPSSVGNTTGDSEDEKDEKFVILPANGVSTPLARPKSQGVKSALPNR